MGMSNKRVLVKKMHEDAVIPKYAKAGDAGFDLVAVEDVIIMPGDTKIVKTGLAFAIPEGYEIQIRPRSGVSAKTSIRVANAPGTIDSGYRGELGIILHNTETELMRIESNPRTRLDTEYSHYLEAVSGGFIKHPEAYPEGTVIVEKGDRIAQGVLSEVPTAIFEEVTELGDTERGEGGFGSSGV